MEIDTNEEVIVPLLNCQECSRNYGDDCIPRTLLCGHTLCTLCTKCLLANEKPCPECLAEQQKNYVNEQPVNYPLLRLSQSLRKKGINVSDGRMMILSLDITQSNSVQELSKCGLHGSPNVLFCRSCNSWICADCSVLNHPFPPRGMCCVLQLPIAIDQVRAKFNEVASEILRDIKTTKANSDLRFGMHDFCLKHCTKERSHLRLIDHLEPFLLEKRKEDEEVKKIMENLTNLIASLNNAQWPDEITSSCRELLSIREKSAAIILRESKRRKRPPKLMLEHFRMELKRLVGKGKSIYAKLQEDDNVRWSVVSLKDEQLLLYALNEGQPPSDDVIVPYGLVEMLIEDDDKITVFFEVEDDEQTLSGRVFVKLHHFSPLNYQMFMMCSGKKGVSFRNTRFSQRDKGRISGGSHLKEDGTTQEPIVDGLSNCYISALAKSISSRRAVMGERTSTTLHFLLQNENQHLYTFIGFVTQGFDVIKSIAKLENVTKAFIKDCGIFLRMKTRVPGYYEGAS